MLEGNVADDPHRLPAQLDGVLTLGSGGDLLLVVIHLFDLLLVVVELGDQRSLLVVGTAAAAANLARTNGGERNDDEGCHGDTSICVSVVVAVFIREEIIDWLNVATIGGLQQAELGNHCLLKKIDTKIQKGDLFTKPFSRVRFQELRRLVLGW